MSQINRVIEENRKEFENIQGFYGKDGRRAVELFDTHTKKLIEEIKELILENSQEKYVGVTSYLSTNTDMVMLELVKLSKLIEKE